ncbi:MAG: hypothetical protein D6781_05400, partial [Verrucomicrobia bacterium]
MILSSAPVNHPAALPPRKKRRTKSPPRVRDLRRQAFHTASTQRNRLPARPIAAPVRAQSIAFDTCGLFPPNTKESIMPTTKIDVAHFLDHGPLASTTALAPRTGLSHTGADTPPRPTPEETDAAVMERIRSVVFSSGNAGTRLAGLVKRARTPAQAAAAFINARHGALGGPRGVLGKATTAVKPCPDKIGYFRNYEGGSIYYSPQTGAHEIRGAIRTKWIQLGAERGFLGYPTTGERTGADRDARGRYNHFQHGSIYWHPSTGAHEVHGAIHAKYVELGAEASFLGYPTTDERQTPDRRGRFNHFQAGSIYWTPQTGAHEIHGLIRKLWAEKGWERNPDLGYPISDERIPHRSVGHVPPPRRRKPLRELPADVVRVPDEQPSPTLELIAAPALATALAASPSAAEEPAPSRSRGSNPDLRHLGGLSLRRIPSGTALRPGIVLKPPKIINPSRNHKGESRDRFSDFENGVLFWIRGASAATELSPRAKAPNGDRLAWNAG